MPRKTTILIVILAVVTGVLIFLAARSERTPDTDNMTSAPSPTSIQPYSTLSFSEESINASASTAAQTVDVIIDTAGQPVAGAQVELSYDPRVITNVRLTPARDPFFGQNAAVLINSVDSSQGRISYAAGISPDEAEKTGTGSLVTLTFNVNRLAGVSTSSISFLTKSTVNTLRSQGSVLKSSPPLQIVIASPTTAQ